MASTIRAWTTDSSWPALSASAASVWAKSNQWDESHPDDYLQLWQHLQDTAETAGYVWDEFLAPHVRQLVVEDLGISTDEAKTLFQFIAAVHDVGKASPAFVIQDRNGVERAFSRGGLHAPAEFNTPMRSKVRHELVGAMSLQAWLQRQVGFQPAAAEALAVVVAGHHGTSLTSGKINTFQTQPDLVGTGVWQHVRDEFFEWAARGTGADELLPRLGSTLFTKRIQILLTGTLIFADWVASNDELFPLNHDQRDEQHFDAVARAESAWQQLSLPRAWRPPDAPPDPDDLFRQRFNLPGASLRPSQRAFVEAAQAVERPSLMILEANMGEGKTEAALLAAEILAQKFGLGGVYYALPTQATVNAMFTRYLRWIESFPSDHRLDTTSVFLAHGKRNLNEQYAHLSRPWATSNIATDESRNEQIGLRAVADAWLSGRKKGNLSSFVDGTIDQVLMTGLKAKHAVLRHLALAGKVVILDEVHAIDAYMNAYLDTVLSWLAAYEVPVIMLSATLPQNRREAFLAAYEQGRSEGVTGRGAEFAAAADEEDLFPDLDDEEDLFPDLDAEDDEDAVAEALADESSDAKLRPPDAFETAYPLISITADAGDRRTLRPSSSGRHTDITLSVLDEHVDGEETGDVLVAALRTRLADGGCAVVIRNTVRRAQKTFHLLRASFPEADVTLDHSRFLAFDRARIDADLVARFGPDGGSRVGTHIVVATQVIEQSLDVDFDVMVSDLAPIDLLMQRSGRLHRHARGPGQQQRPERLRQAELLITGVDWQAEMPEPERGSAFIYGDHLLLRTLAVLDVRPDQSRTCRVPDELPSLVQRVYGTAMIGPAAWQDAMAEAAEKWRQKQADRDARARLFRIDAPQDGIPGSLLGWLDGEAPDPESVAGHEARASVRDSEDSVEVYALRKRDGQFWLVTDDDNPNAQPLPTSFGVPNLRQRNQILRSSIALNRVNTQMSVGALILALEDSQPEFIRTDWQSCPALAGQLFVLLDEEGEFTLTAENRRGSTTRCFRYTSAEGLQLLEDGQHE